MTRGPQNIHELIAEIGTEKGIEKEISHDQILGTAMVVVRLQENFIVTTSLTGNECINTNTQSNKSKCKLGMGTGFDWKKFEE